MYTWVRVRVTTELIQLIVVLLFVTSSCLQRCSLRFADLRMADDGVLLSVSLVSSVVGFSLVGLVACRLTGLSELKNEY